MSQNVGQGNDDPMALFSARPERIVGNVALASLCAGVPLGLLISALAALRMPSSLAWSAAAGDIALGAAVATTGIFVCGLVILAPVLALLRSFGLGGPFFVHAIGLAVAAPFFANGLGAGLAVAAMALAAGVVFCRFAYPERRDECSTN